jgi:hypothetical protein
MTRRSRPVPPALPVVALIWMVGCDGTNEAPSAAPEPQPVAALPMDGPDPRSEAAAVKTAVGDAKSLWGGGDRAGAKARIMEAYFAHFQPIEPILRRQDAQATLELEFAFGALADRMGRRGDAGPLNEESAALVTRIESLVAAIPAEALPTTPSPTLSGPPPVSVEATPPRADLHTFGDAKN